MAIETSSMSIGHEPTEWWILVPTLGQPSSTPRIRDAPTTQEAYSHPSARTSKTSCAEQFNSRLVSLMVW